MDMLSHFMVGHVTGMPAHGSIVLELFPMAEMFWNNTGKLWIILIGLIGSSLPFLIRNIPLRAVQEKSPLIGFTG